MGLVSQYQALFCQCQGLKTFQYPQNSLDAAICGCNYFTRLCWWLQLWKSWVSSHWFSQKCVPHHQQEELYQADDKMAHPSRSLPSIHKLPAVDSSQLPCRAFHNLWIKQLGGQQWRWWWQWPGQPQAIWWSWLHCCQGALHSRLFHCYWFWCHWLSSPPSHIPLYFSKHLTLIYCIDTQHPTPCLQVSDSLTPSSASSDKTGDKGCHPFLMSFACWWSNICCTISIWYSLSLRVWFGWVFGTSVGW